MADIDRLVTSLVRSDVPLERDALRRHAIRIAPEVAPLAPEEAVRAAVDAIVGMGPLEPLIEDPSVTDVLVNGPDDVWIERHGALERTDVSFRGDEDVVAMVRRVIAPLGLRIDRASPAVDARLADGSRLHAIIPPAAVDHPIVAVRRFVEAVRSLDDLVACGSATRNQADRLRRVVADRRNLLIAGATGSGKTTLLNILIGEVPSTDRVVTVEDAAEVRAGAHTVRLEARSANVEGAGAVTMRSLVRHALRLRPDRIVVGEVRGPEALDMVSALTTGHRGSMSTIHANGTSEALARLEALAAMAPEHVPHDALARLVAGAIEIVVVMTRTPEGRCVSSIEEVGS